MPESNDTTLDDDFWRFLDEFAQESDRAAVIVGAVKLDIHLEQLKRDEGRSMEMKVIRNLATFSAY